MSGCAAPGPTHALQLKVKAPGFNLLAMFKIDESGKNVCWHWCLRRAHMRLQDASSEFQQARAFAGTYRKQFAQPAIRVH